MTVMFSIQESRPVSGLIPSSLTPPDLSPNGIGIDVDVVETSTPEHHHVNAPVISDVPTPSLQLTLTPTLELSDPNHKSLLGEVPLSPNDESRPLYPNFKPLGDGHSYEGSVLIPHHPGIPWVPGVEGQRQTVTNQSGNSSQVREGEVYESVSPLDWIDDGDSKTNQKGKKRTRNKKNLKLLGDKGLEKTGRDEKEQDNINEDDGEEMRAVVSNLLVKLREVPSSSHHYQSQQPRSRRNSDKLLYLSQERNPYSSPSSPSLNSIIGSPRSNIYNSGVSNMSTPFGIGSPLRSRESFDEFSFEQSGSYMNSRSSSRTRASRRSSRSGSVSSTGESNPSKSGDFAVELEQQLKRSLRLKSSDSLAESFKSLASSSNRITSLRAQRRSWQSTNNRSRSGALTPCSQEGGVGGFFSSSARVVSNPSSPTASFNDHWQQQEQYPESQFEAQFQQHLCFNSINSGLGPPQSQSHSQAQSNFEPLSMVEEEAQEETSKDLWNDAR